MKHHAGQALRKKTGQRTSLLLSVVKDRDLRQALVLLEQRFMTKSFRIFLLLKKRTDSPVRSPPLATPRTCTVTMSAKGRTPRATPPHTLTHTLSIKMGERMSSSCGSRRAVAAAALTLLSATVVLQPAEAHPGCKPGNGVTLIKNPNNQFCPTDKDPLYEDGFCCNANLEAKIVTALDGSGATGECAAMYQEVRGSFGVRESDHVGPSIDSLRR